MYDFANILFSGPCSARCYFCIGGQIDHRLNQPNLDRYPLLGIEPFMQRIWQERIPQVVFTGTNTDPQLYRHEARLLDTLRRHLPSGVKFSLHTNARQALRRMSTFNLYDRATLSFPSFDPQTYQQMMGVPDPPDLAEIVRQARLPLKVSCLVDEHNGPELRAFLGRCQDLGLRRVVLRKMYGAAQPWQAWLEPLLAEMQPCPPYRGNPVYRFRGLEITLWDFEVTQSSALNLFANGTLSDQYLLVNAPESPDLQAHKTLSYCSAVAPASSMA